jgi:glycosyltransferase involved in cell wall biosynthesis
MSDKTQNIERLEEALARIDNKENAVYFLCYDTKGNARAAIKHIYDLALITKNNGFNSKILVEDKNYPGVSAWLGEEYSVLDVVSVKEDKIELKIDDILVVPEYYANILPQLNQVRCVKIMLIQQKEYMYETLSIGSRFSDYGFDKIIATTNKTKEYIQEYFPENLVYVIPPIVEDIFTKNEQPIKPYIAISFRDRMQHRKLISEFYIKYPQLRWITFRDMVQMSYEEFADNLKECFVAIWRDDESTFGTFPIEAMKCSVPVIGKIPDTEPDWLGENGMWTYDPSKLVEILGTYALAWLEGAEIGDDVKEKMRETIAPYDKEVISQSIVSIFQSFENKRKETIISALDKLKEEETV